MTSQHCASGFALVEVMVSLFVAAASVLAMAMISGHTQRETRAMVKEHRAWCLGVEMVTWLRTGAGQSRSNLSTNYFERVQNLATPPDCYKVPCTASDAAEIGRAHV